MMDDLDARIGRRLRQLRLRAGLDVEGLASRAAVPPAAVERYEAGRVRVPADELLRFAGVLGAEVSAFFA